MGRIKPRWFRHNLQTALRVLPVTVLTGARQTGKTTLTQAIEPTRAYVTLDDVTTNRIRIGEMLHEGVDGRM